MKDFFKSTTGRLLLVIAAVAVVVVMVIVYAINLAGDKAGKKDDIPSDTVVAEEDTPEEMVSGGETVTGELTTEDQRLAQVIADNSQKMEFRITQTYNATEQNYSATYGFTEEMYDADGTIALKDSADSGYKISADGIAHTYLDMHQQEILDFFDLQCEEYAYRYCTTGKEQGPYLDATSWFPNQLEINIGGESHTFTVDAVVASPSMSGKIDAKNILVFSSNVYQDKKENRYYADGVRFSLYGTLN